MLLVLGETNCILLAEVENNTDNHGQDNNHHRAEKGKYDGWNKLKQASGKKHLTDSTDIVSTWADSRDNETLVTMTLNKQENHLEEIFYTLKPDTCLVQRDWGADEC